MAYPLDQAPDPLRDELRQIAPEVQQAAQEGDDTRLATSLRQYLTERSGSNLEAFRQRLQLVHDLQSELQGSFALQPEQAERITAIAQDVEKEFIEQRYKNGGLLEDTDTLLHQWGPDMLSQNAKRGIVAAAGFFGIRWLWRRFRSAKKVAKEAVPEKKGFFGKTGTWLKRAAIVAGVLSGGWWLLKHTKIGDLLKFSESIDDAKRKAEEEIAAMQRQYEEVKVTVQELSGEARTEGERQLEEAKRKIEEKQRDLAQATERAKTTVAAAPAAASERAQAAAAATTDRARQVAEVVAPRAKEDAQTELDHQQANVLSLEYLRRHRAVAEGLGIDLRNEKNYRDILSDMLREDSPVRDLTVGELQQIAGGGLDATTTLQGILGRQPTPEQVQVLRLIAAVTADRMAQNTGERVSEETTVGELVARDSMFLAALSRVRGVVARRGPLTNPFEIAEAAFGGASEELTGLAGDLNILRSLGLIGEGPLTAEDRAVVVAFTEFCTVHRGDLLDSAINAAPNEHLAGSLAELRSSLRDPEVLAYLQLYTHGKTGPSQAIQRHIAGDGSPESASNITLKDALELYTALRIAIGDGEIPTHLSDSDSLGATLTQLKVMQMLYRVARQAAIELEAVLGSKALKGVEGLSLPDLPPEAIASLRKIYEVGLDEAERQGQRWYEDITDRAYFYGAEFLQEHQPYMVGAGGAAGAVLFAKNVNAPRLLYGRMTDPLATMEARLRVLGGRGGIKNPRNWLAFLSRNMRNAKNTANLAQRDVVEGVAKVFEELNKVNYARGGIIDRTFFRDPLEVRQVRRLIDRFFRMGDFSDTACDTFLRNIQGLRNSGISREAFNELMKFGENVKTHQNVLWRARFKIVNQVWNRLTGNVPGSVVVELEEVAESVALAIVRRGSVDDILKAGGTVDDALKAGRSLDEVCTALRGLSPEARVTGLQRLLRSMMGDEIVRAGMPLDDVVRALSGLDEELRVMHYGYFLEQGRDASALVRSGANVDEVTRARHALAAAQSTTGARNAAGAAGGAETVTPRSAAPESTPTPRTTASEGIPPRASAPEPSAPRPSSAAAAEDVARTGARAAAAAETFPGSGTIDVTTGGLYDETGRVISPLESAPGRAGVAAGAGQAVSPAEIPFAEVVEEPAVRAPRVPPTEQVPLAEAVDEGTGGGAASGRGTPPRTPSSRPGAGTPEAAPASSRLPSSGTSTDVPANRLGNRLGNRMGGLEDADDVFTAELVDRPGAAGARFDVPEEMGMALFGRSEFPTQFPKASQAINTVGFSTKLRTACDDSAHFARVMSSTLEKADDPVAVLKHLNAIADGLDDPLLLSRVCFSEAQITKVLGAADVPAAFGKLSEVLANTGRLQPNLLRALDESPQFAAAFARHLETAADPARAVEVLNQTAGRLDDPLVLGKIATSEGKLMKVVDNGGNLFALSKTAKALKALTAAGMAVDAFVIYTTVLEIGATNARIAEMKRDGRDNQELRSLYYQEYGFHAAQLGIAGTGLVTGGVALAGIGGTVAGPVALATLPVSAMLYAGYEGHKWKEAKTRTAADWSAENDFATLITDARSYDFGERVGHGWDLTLDDWRWVLMASPLGITHYYGNEAKRWITGEMKRDMGQLVADIQRVDAQKVRSIVEQTTFVTVPNTVMGDEGEPRDLTPDEIVLYQEAARRFVDAKVQYILSQARDKSHAIHSGADVAALMREAEDFATLTQQEFLLGAQGKPIPPQWPSAALPPRERAAAFGAIRRHEQVESLNTRYSTLALLASGPEERAGLERALEQEIGNLLATETQPAVIRFLVECKEENFRSEFYRFGFDGNASEVLGSYLMEQYARFLREETQRITTTSLDRIQRDFQGQDAEALARYRVTALQQDIEAAKRRLQDTFLAQRPRQLWESMSEVDKQRLNRATVAPPAGYFPKLTEALGEAAADAVPIEQALLNGDPVPASGDCIYVRSAKGYRIASMREGEAPLLSAVRIIDTDGPVRLDVGAYAVFRPGETAYEPGMSDYAPDALGLAGTFIARPVIERARTQAGAERRVQPGHLTLRIERRHVSAEEQQHHEALLQRRLGEGARVLREAGVRPISGRDNVFVLKRSVLDRGVEFAFDRESGRWLVNVGGWITSNRSRSVSALSGQDPASFRVQGMAFGASNDYNTTIERMAEVNRLR
jgi:hypothetical protein